MTDRTLEDCGVLAAIQVDVSAKILVRQCPPSGEFPLPRDLSQWKCIVK